MTLQELLVRLAPSARATTGNYYYDATYPGLVRAGRALRESAPGFGHVALEDAIILAHGLAGWNTGPSRYVASEALLKAVENPNHRPLAELAEQLSALERELPSEQKQRGEAIKWCFDSARGLLRQGKYSAGLPTKLLHWLSPALFPPLDSNIRAVLESRAPSLFEGIGSAHTPRYVAYVSELWALGFTQDIPKGALTMYWAFQVTPMRVVDCTLFALARNR